MDPERRHPILLAALAAAHTEIVDETVRVFDMMLSATDANAHDQVAKRQLDTLQANLERLELLDDILDVVLDPDLDDNEVGGAVRALGPRFKYLEDHHGLHWLCDYHMSLAPDTAPAAYRRQPR